MNFERATFLQLNFFVCRVSPPRPLLCQTHQDHQHYHLACDEAKEVDAVLVVHILAKELDQGLLFLLLILNHPVEGVGEGGDGGDGGDGGNLVVVPLPKNFMRPPSSISQRSLGR